MSRWVILLLLLVFASSFGCAGFSEYRRQKVERRRAQNQMRDSTNALWKEGYGFNNPNNDRRREGLPPVNFNGTPERKNNYVGDLIGDMITYSAKSTFTAVADRLRRE